MRAFVALISGYLLSLRPLADAACTCANTADCNRITTPARTKEVFMFHLPGGSDWMNYDLSIITTVAVFSNSFVDPTFLCYAHSKGVRVVLTKADFDYSQLTNAAARTAWATTIAGYVDAANADGLNIDLEFADPIGQPAAMTALVKETTRILRLTNPAAQVTFDVNIHPLWHSTGYNYPAIAAECDFLVP